MNEPRPVTSRQHLGVDQASGQPRGGGHRHACDRGRVPQFAVVPQHGQGLRQAKCARAQGVHPGDDLPGNSLQLPGQQLRRPQRGQRPAAEVRRPQQLGKVQQVTAAGRVHGRAQLIAGLAACRGAHHGTDRLLAQQRGPQNRRLRAHRQERGTDRRRVARAHRHQQSGGQPLQPRRQVSQPPQRGLIGPVRVIDGDQQRPTGRQVDHQPVQAMQHRERAIISRLDGDLPGQQRPHGGGWACQQRSTFVFPCRRQAPFEQLEYQPEGETRLQS